MVISEHEISILDFKSTSTSFIRFPSSDSSTDHRPTYIDIEWINYCPDVFRILQEYGKIQFDDYMASICGQETVRQLISHGKSGFLLYLSHDDRFVLKTINKQELKAFLEKLPTYYHHVRKYKNTLLTKFYGLHVFKQASGQKVYFVVMGNVLHSDLYIHKRFDLKGSSRGRSFNIQSSLEDDLDIVFHLDTSTRNQLIKQMKHDCNFLESMGVTDYSLLLGIHLSSPSHPSPSESLNKSSISPVQSINKGSHSPAPSLNKGSYSPSESLNKGSCSPSESLNKGSCSPAPSLNKGSRSPAPSLSKGSCSPSESLNKGSCSPSDSLNKGSCSPSEPPSKGSSSPAHLTGSDDNKVISARDSFSQGDMNVDSSSIDDLQLHPYFTEPTHKLGVKLEARAVRKNISLLTTGKGKGNNVKLFFEITDILQEYSMVKRVENVFKALTPDSHHSTGANPKSYSMRFQDFICQIFPENDPRDSFL